MNTKPTTNWAPTLAIIALALSLVAFSKAGNTPIANREDSLAKIQRTKEMHVCVAEWPPFSSKDAQTGKYTGVDIEAMEIMAKSLGATPKYHDTTFGNAPAALQSGTCDVTTSLYITPTRSAAISFTRPILFGGDTALVRKGDTRFKTLEDIDKPGVKVATATGESGDLYAKANFSKATVVSIDVEAADQTRFLLEVTSGRADIGIADYNTIANFAKEHPVTEVVFEEHPFNLSPDAYGVRYGDTNFLNFLNNSILIMQGNGEWDKLEKKHNAEAFHQQLDIR